ncbi:MAG: acyl-ACP--UDP-N-acetylglucosamine O-acyltransferase [Phycisphaerae bacterium]|nr:acyl-ACP--UDP-N-acetylglucosamine O-acyltransferase [Phycisphaerae bacterium]
MSNISPLAVIEDGAEIHPDNEIGPFCLIGRHVKLGRGNKLLSHVVLTGHTTIGDENIFHPHCVIGGTPQDLKYRGEPTGASIGDRNVFREACTVNIGTDYGARINGGGITRLGNDNLLMVNAHIGHDAQFGNNCIISNNVMIAGHVVCGNNVAMMAQTGVNHFVTVGDYSYMAACTQVMHDVPPFTKISDFDDVRGVNTIGLRRGGFAEDDIEALSVAVRRLFLNKEKAFCQVLDDYETENHINPSVKQLVQFLRRRDQGKHGRFLEGLR